MPLIFTKPSVFIKFVEYYEKPHLQDEIIANGLFCFERLGVVEVQENDNTNIPFLIPPTPNHRSETIFE
mgnify:CR=1 FL=1